MIKKKGKKYTLTSKKGRKLGEATSRKGIERREKEVEMFKHMKNK
jgi:hypothetical protein